jgi:predicted DNA repair protein MutK
MTDIWAIVLAVASAIVLLSNAVEKIVKAFKAAKAPENAQNKKIAEIEDRLKKVEGKLETDKKRIDDANNCNHVLTKGMLALLDHGINGNNIDQMKDARHDVETYLINH